MDMEFTFRLSTTPKERSVMSDWISKLKSSDDEARKKEQREIDLRLHRAAVAKAKAPFFWSSLLDCLKSDCTKLAEVFPDDVSRQCSFGAQGENGFVLTGHAAHRKLLRLTLNLNAMTLDEEIFSDGDTQRQSQRSSFKLDVDSNDEFKLSQGVDLFTSPASFAETLIKRVCEIKDRP
jgi:hypothetical protein